jgi:GNAT superfamily N-acetyltransferase
VNESLASPLHNGPHQECHVRCAAPTEAHFLSDLALRSKALWGYSPEFLDACRDELTYTAEQIADPERSFAVAELGGVVAGFYQLEGLSRAEPELGALFVDPAKIGRGIGRLLLRHAEREARERGAAALVIQSDPYALGFYIAEGAVVTGWRESGSIAGRFLPLLWLSLNARPEREGEQCHE